MRVLVVDDDLAVQRHCREILETEGFEVVCESSLGSARRFLRHGQADTLLLDLFLPDGSGYDLFRTSGDLLEGLPVVAMTAVYQGSANARLLGMRHPFASVLPKPLETGALVEVLRGILGSSYPATRRPRAQEEATVVVPNPNHGPMSRSFNRPITLRERSGLFERPSALSAPAPVTPAPLASNGNTSTLPSVTDFVSPLDPMAGGAGGLSRVSSGVAPLRAEASAWDPTGERRDAGFVEPATTERAARPSRAVGTMPAMTSTPGASQAGPLPAAPQPIAPPPAAPPIIAPPPAAPAPIPAPAPAPSPASFDPAAPSPLSPDRGAQADDGWGGTTRPEATAASSGSSGSLRRLESSGSIRRLESAPPPPSSSRTTGTVPRIHSQQLRELSRSQVNQVLPRPAPQSLHPMPSRVEPPPPQSAISPRNPDSEGLIVPASLDPRRAPLQGRLEDTPFPVVLVRLLQSQASGSLLLRRDKVKKILFIEQGVPRSVKSNLLYECLGQLLVRENIINEVACQASVDRFKAEGRLQGEVMVDMGLLTPHELNQALERQFEIKLLDVFTWPQGLYQFRPAPPERGHGRGSSRDPLELILECSRRGFPVERAVADFSPLMGHIPTLLVSRSELKVLSMTEDERDWLRLLDNRRSLGHILSATGGADGVYLFFHALICMGLMAFRAQEPAYG